MESLQDVADSRGCRSPEGLDQSGLCIRDLVRSCLTPQLQDCFNSLIQTRRGQGYVLG